MSRLHERIAVVAALAMLLPLIPVSAHAAGPGYAFTYQGSLSDNGTPSTGPYDFQCTLWDAAGGGTQIGPTLTLDDRQVTSGVFAIDLDFGPNAYVGDARWLEVGIRPGASTGAYSLLPRQKLNPSPFAIGLSLPHFQVFNSSSPLIGAFNTGTGPGAEFIAGGTTKNYGVLGINGSNASQAAGVRGEAGSNSGLTIGVEGVATASPNGTGLVGTGGATGAYLTATGPTSTGAFAIGTLHGLSAQSTGFGSAIVATGQGQTRSNATLWVDNTQLTHGMAEYAHNNSDYATSHFQNDGTGQVMWLEHHGTGHYIVATSGSDWKFWVDNAGVTHTKVLEILGGSDLSEKFDVGGADDEIEPGTVVSIDPAHEGRLQPSSTPYDRRVAGVISGAGGVKPGMLMGQDGSVASGKLPVALTGRVYCRATASNGSIVPGDLLTTSSVPGLCMRVDDPSRAQGAILGKAMGSLEKGEGLVLVLVGLQ
jgi:hypothetical protein